MTVRQSVLAFVCLLAPGGTAFAQSCTPTHKIDQLVTRASSPSRFTSTRPFP